MPKFIRVFTRTTVLLFLIAVAGCASSGAEKPAQPNVSPVPIFPPQSVLQGGDYGAFRADNETALQACGEPEKCALALFNLSFVYCYSKSPYYNPSKGLLYLEDLIKGAPDSPWAYHARVWTDLLRKGMKMEARKRPAREDAKSKEAAAGEAARQAEQQESRQPEVQQDAGPDAADRQRLEEEIRSRDETIKELNRQIQRAHQIDIEIEKKERGLLY
ncbi:MAG: hypothetical protein ABFD97_04475 [Syntrophobacter sp.]